LFTLCWGGEGGVWEKAWACVQTSCITSVNFDIKILIYQANEL
jgi:hypothetical protein